MYPFTNICNNFLIKKVILEGNRGNGFPQSAITSIWLIASKHNRRQWRHHTTEVFQKVKKKQIWCKCTRIKPIHCAFKILNYGY